MNYISAHIIVKVSHCNDPHQISRKGVTSEVICSSQSRGLEFLRLALKVGLNSRRLFACRGHSVR